MRLPVPYFKQSTDYSCGPTVLQMIATYFNHPCPMDEVKQLTCRSADQSTSNADLVSAAERLGLKVYYKESAELDDIRKFLKKKIPVVVNYIEVGADEGHFAIVVEITDTHIVMNDPEHGQDYSMPLAEFAPRWRSGFEKYEKWMMAAWPKSRLSRYLDSIFRRTSPKSSA